MATRTNVSMVASQFLPEPPEVRSYQQSNIAGGITLNLCTRVLIELGLCTPQGRVVKCAYVLIAGIWIYTCYESEINAAGRLVMDFAAFYALIAACYAKYALDRAAAAAAGSSNQLAQAELDLASCIAKAIAAFKNANNVPWHPAIPAPPV